MLSIIVLYSEFGLRIDACRLLLVQDKRIAERDSPQVVFHELSEAIQRRSGCRARPSYSSQILLQLALIVDRWYCANLHSDVWIRTVGARCRG